VPSPISPPLRVTPAAVRAAVSSFPNGSAGGPDGLRPQHLKDLLVNSTNKDPLLSDITNLCNLFLSGNIPNNVCPTIFGANLLAISKKGGGVRPIAVGYVWRRLTAKVVCSHVKDRSLALLAPRQLGFAVKGGAEGVGTQDGFFFKTCSLEKYSLTSTSKMLSIAFGEIAFLTSLKSTFPSIPT